MVGLSVVFMSLSSTGNTIFANDIFETDPRYTALEFYSFSQGEAVWACEFVSDTAGMCMKNMKELRDSEANVAASFGRRVSPFGFGFGYHLGLEIEFSRWCLYVLAV